MTIPNQFYLARFVLWKQFTKDANLCTKTATVDVVPIEQYLVSLRWP